MHIVERGEGTPIVLVPGLQGRWEFHNATVDALSSGARVLTFSLTEAPSEVDDVRRIDLYRDQIVRALDAARIDRAAVCGISYGGLPALRFAATRADRISKLILASTPGPRFHLRPRHELYTRWPRLFGPLFAIETPRRLGPEMRAALPDARERWRFRWSHLRTALSAPVSFTGMAARARSITSYDRGADAAHVSCPTLIVVGEERLDWVVKPHSTVQYATLIDRSRQVTLPETGHLGSMTHAPAFAALVLPFATADSNSHDSAA
jgi:pimeloyl-ACP methyl ester carboxylesterase